MLDARAGLLEIPLESKKHSADNVCFTAVGKDHKRSRGKKTHGIGRCNESYSVHGTSAWQLSKAMVTKLWVRTR